MKLLNKYKRNKYCDKDFIDIAIDNINNLRYPDTYAVVKVDYANCKVSHVTVELHNDKSVDE